MRQLPMAEGRSDLDRVTTNWDEATSTLIGHSLPVIRVERGGGRVCVIWRTEPTPDQIAKANSLLHGVAPSHGW